MFVIQADLQRNANGGGQGDDDKGSSTPMLHKQNISFTYAFLRKQIITNTYQNKLYKQT